jgi:hypothetical protein
MGDAFDDAFDKISVAPAKEETPAEEEKTEQNEEA